MRHITAVWFTVAVIGVVACGSSPSPVSPSLDPVSLLSTMPGTAEGPHAMGVSRPPGATAIVIDRGDLDLSASGGALSLFGTRGFSLVGGVTRAGGVAEAFEACAASDCAPGALIPLTAAWSGTDLPGSVTLDGIAYTQVGSLSTPTAAEVQFSGTLVAPAFTSRDFQTVTAAFTLRGQFVHVGSGGVLIADAFSGEGLARVSLANRSGNSGWSVERVVYKLKHQP